VLRAEVARDAVGPDLRLVGYLAYGVGLSLAALSAMLLLLLRRGGRASAAARPGRRGRVP
jgi:hypothetical protein